MFIYCFLKLGISSITSNSNKKNKEDQVQNQNTLKNKNNAEGEGSAAPPQKTDRKLSLNSVVSSAGLMSKLRDNNQVASASNQQQNSSVMKGVLDAFKTSNNPQPGGHLVWVWDEKFCIFIGKLHAVARNASVDNLAKKMSS